MPKINTSATLWHTIRLQVNRTIRELILEHSAEVLSKARNNGRIIGFEGRCLLFGSFLLEYPFLRVEFNEFSATLNLGLGRPYRLYVRSR